LKRWKHTRFPLPIELNAANEGA